MTQAKLTARMVESVKPTSGKRAEYFDAAVSGLALRVTETGHKSWTLLYRHRGRLRRLTLGTAAVLGLADARSHARNALARVHGGGDPAANKQQARQAETIGDLVTHYIEKHAKRHKRSWKEDERMLRVSVLPEWNHRPIGGVRRGDVRTLVDTIAERAPVMANRVLACVRKMFSFAVDHELVESNPASRIARPSEEHSRERVLTEDELRQLWRLFDALPQAMGAFYKLRLVTAQRGGEVVSMRWSDVDLETGWWTIPAARSKNKKGHRVPLSPLALAIVKSLLPARGMVHPDVPNSLAYVLAGARGKRQRSEAATTFGVPDFRGHDLRRTAASAMASAGISRLVIGKILNHAERDVTAVYDRHSYDAEKRAALECWAAKLKVILKKKPRRQSSHFPRSA